MDKTVNPNAGQSPALVVQIDEFARKVITVEKETELWTTSHHVAEEFGKRHDNVIQAIERLGASAEFRLLNFQETSCTDSFGREQPMYRISEDGFMLLVMGFTGPKAMVVKERWVGAFQWMRKEIIRLLSITTLPKTPQILRELADTYELNERITQENLALVARCEEMRPKAQYAEHITQAVNCKRVAQVAKVLGWGPIKLFAWLRDHSYLMDGGEKGDRDPKHNIPFQKHIDSGLFRLREGKYQHKESLEWITYTVPLITAKGQKRIYDQLCSEGVIVPREVGMTG